MDEFVVLAALLKLGYALIAGLGLVYFTRWLDHRAQVPFNEVGELIRREPMAAAIYYGCRILGMSILVGMVIG